MAFVRRRLWSRRRARLSSMTASIMRQMNDAAIRKLSRDELQQCIVSAGLTYQDCDIEELRRRFAEVCAVETCLQASAPITAEAEPCPIMPPVQANRKIELQLPGSSWSHALSLEATGTHGLLELLPVEYHQPVVALRRAYQLGLSVTSAPGQFGRSKMLVVDHRILLVNRCDAAPIGPARDRVIWPAWVLRLFCAFSPTRHLNPNPPPARPPNAGCSARLDTRSMARKESGSSCPPAHARPFTGKSDGLNVCFLSAC